MNFVVKALDENCRLAWEGLYKGYATYYGMPMPDATVDTVWKWIQEGGLLQGRIAIEASGPVVKL